VGVDAVASKAGVTKRTLYYHFASKDDLVAAYLEGRHQPNLKQLALWYEAGIGGPGAKITSLFQQLAQSVRHPRWRGCAFQRTLAELAAMPGHPARKVGARHKRAFEDWLTAEFEAEALVEPQALARQVSILLDGAFAAALAHRDADYVEAAGDAAEALVALANRLAVRPEEKGQCDASGEH
jgi:AcrR family transcriptional regulator